MQQMFWKTLVMLAESFSVNGVNCFAAVPLLTFGSTLAPPPKAFVVDAPKGEDAFAVVDPKPPKVDVAGLLPNKPPPVADDPKTDPELLEDPNADVVCCGCCCCCCCC